MSEKARFHTGGFVKTAGTEEVPAFLPNEHVVPVGSFSARAVAARYLPPIPTKKWDDYLMSHAALAASKSKDSTQVGAALVGPDNEVLLTAYNGAARGVEDTPERLERPRKYNFVCHAEANLVAFAARNGISTRGCKVYTTHASCGPCAALLAQAGIFEVVYGPGKTNMDPQSFADGQTTFSEAGVNSRKAL